MSSPTKKALCTCLSTLMLCACAFAQDAANSGFRSLHVDAGKVTGEIRSFQGLNGPPSPVMAGLPNLAQQYTDLRISQVRTHDFMGPRRSTRTSIKRTPCWRGLFPTKPSGPE